MALPIVIMYQGDLLPVLEVEVLDQNGAVLNLSTVDTVRLWIAADGAQPIVQGSQLTITNAPKGLCQYSWLPGDTNAPGDYTGEIVVFIQGKPEVAGQFSLKILNSIHGAN